MVWPDRVEDPAPGQQSGERVQAQPGGSEDLAEAVCQKGGEDEHDSAVVVHRSPVLVRREFRLLEVPFLFSWFCTLVYHWF